MSPPSSSSHAASARTALTHLGSAMVATGETVHEVEEELLEASTRLGYPDVQVAAGPTGVFVSLHPGDVSAYQSVRGPLRLDQAVDVRRILHHLLHSGLSPDDAVRQLVELRTKSARFPRWLYWVGAVGVAVGIALILQPGWANVAAAGVVGLVVTSLSQLSARSGRLATLLPTVAAFVAACLVFAAADAGWLDGSLRTLLPPLAVLLPGALLVTGLSELASGHMVAGSSRLAFGLVQLLLLSLGVLTASEVLRVPPESLGNVRVDQLGWWAAPVGLVCLSVGVCFLESASLRLLPWILLVLVLAASAQGLGQRLSGIALGGLLGAIAASLGASACTTIRPRLPRLVIFTPAFWLLVPGSLGLLSVTALADNPAQTIRTQIDVVNVVSAIALGLLVGSAVGRSLDALVRRRPRATADGSTSH